MCHPPSGLVPLGRCRSPWGGLRMPGMTKSRSNARRSARVSPGRVVRCSMSRHLRHPNQPVGDGVGVESFAKFAAGLGRLDMGSQHVADSVAERAGRCDGDRHGQAFGREQHAQPSGPPRRLRSRRPVRRAGGHRRTRSPTAARSALSMTSAVSRKRTKARTSSRVPKYRYTVVRCTEASLAMSSTVVRLTPRRS